MPSRLLLVFTVLISACGNKWSSADVDGDGYAPSDGDCWDAVEGPAGSGLTGAEIHPGATETWYDGFDQDCDGAVDDDQDGDGVPGAADGAGEDCDDEDAAVYPGAEDAWYDGVDADCGGEDDYDQDGDGYGAVGYADGADCDDLDATVNPGIEEVWYNGADENCDGNDTDQDGDGFAYTEDCDDEDETRYPDLSIEEIWYNGEDENCDGNDGDRDGDGYVPDDYAAEHDWEAHNAHVGTGDCWDDDDDTSDIPEEDQPLDGYDALLPSEVSPVAEERWYDGVDQDCDGWSDFDQDGDGQDSEFHANRDGEIGDDCIDGSELDDDNPAGLAPADVGPGAIETWYDGTDQDCEGDDDYDQDLDGYQASGYGVGSDDDCDDTLPDVNPGEREDCSTSMDDNCDGDTNDVGARGCTTYYVDADSDSFGTGSGACLCEVTTTYEVTNDDDCDDTDSEVNPDATEITGDEVDQDCNGRETCYADADNDGYRTTSTKSSTDEDCDDSGEATSSDSSGDCDDTSSSVNPGATETVGDEIDQNCDDAETCYADADDDGYRTSETVSSADEDCDDSGEATSSETSGDCDDSTSSVNPGKSETTGDEIDQNCDGKERCYVDADNDGYRTTSTVTSSDEDCDDSGEAASSETSGDCDDSTSSVNPGATETVGDEIDQDCDDEEICYADADDDGYRTTSTVSSADEDCDDSGEASSSMTSGDCADSDELSYPGAAETCEDDVVNDCEGTESAALEECGWDPSYDPSTAYARRTGEAAGDLAGTRLGFASDLDGDGDDEILVSSTAASSSAGRVYVLNGPPTSGNRSLSTYSYRYTGEASSDELGLGLASGLDTDGDGYGDLLLGAPYNNSTAGDAGAAYLLDGPLPASATLSSSVYAAKLSGAANGDYAGVAVLGLGDVDGDGYDDVAVGAEKGDSATKSNSGMAYLLFGPVATATLSTSTDGNWGGSYSGEKVGQTLAGGDLDADGTPDLVVGSPYARVGTTSNERGRVFVLLGPASGSGTISDVDDVEVRGAADDDHAGTALAAGGDVDGDGADDLLVGAPDVDSGGTGAGAAYLVLGGSSLPTSALTLSSADAVLTGVAAGDAAGASVALADLTGDGLAEVVVGASGADAGGTDRGSVYLFFGSISGSYALSSADITYAGEANTDALGASLAAGGDANEDGYGDLLIGAPTRDPSSSADAGMIYFFPGTGY